MRCQVRPSRNTPKGILVLIRARGQWGRGTTVSFQPGLTLGVQVDRRQDIPRVPKVGKGGRTRATAILCPLQL